MSLFTRTATALALIAALGGCSLSGLLGGGGGKPPATLVTLSPEAPAPADMTRSAAAGRAVTITTPTVPKELMAVRVPVRLSPTDVQYVTNLQLVDTPDHLFQALLSETVRRTTSRLVLDPSQSGLDPGVTVTGALTSFGYDSGRHEVVVAYDATMANGNAVQSRRFTASAPADGTAATVAPALNHAANEVALAAAKWIGS